MLRVIIEGARDVVTTLLALDAVPLGCSGQVRDIDIDAPVAQTSHDAI